RAARICHVQSIQSACETPSGQTLGGKLNFIPRLPYPIEAQVSRPFQLREGFTCPFWSFSVVFAVEAVDRVKSSNSPGFCDGPRLITTAFRHSNAARRLGEI